MNRRLMGLVGLAALLAAYQLWQAFAPSEVPPAAQAGAAGEQGAAPLPGNGAQAVLNPQQGIAAESFPDILERPLFNPGRQPRPPEPPPQVEAPQPEPVAAEPPPPQGPRAEDYKLMGIAAGPSGRVAAVSRVASGDVVYVREGGRLDDWDVRTISEREVQIGPAELGVTLKLFSDLQQGTGAMQPPPSESPAQPQPPDDQPQVTPAPAPLPPQPGAVEIMQ